MTALPPAALVRRFDTHRLIPSLHLPRGDQRRFEGELMNSEGERVGLRIESGEEIWFDWAEVRSGQEQVRSSGVRRGTPPKAPPSGAPSAGWPD